MRKFVNIFIVVLSLAVFTVNCGDVLTGGILDNNPNQPTQVTAQHLLIALQPMTYGFYLADVGWYAIVWMQQMAGIDQQWASYEQYITGNTLFPAFNAMYTEGGLIDIRALKARAAEDSKLTILGLAELYEALMFSAGAEVYGAIPYTEAARGDIFHPHYDTQLSVHTAMLALLDQAITDLNAADPSAEVFNDDWDFSFDGDISKMIAAAHTLKARILLSWTSVTPGNYALALAEAQQGISSTSGNWMAPFQNSANEENLWYQFINNRGDYMRGGKFMVDLLAADNDPRLAYYFGLDEAGGYSGSGHGEEDGTTSWLNLAAGHPGHPDTDMDMVTYEENQYIIAECQHHAGLEVEALATLNAVLGEIETRWGFTANSIQRYAGLTGAALLEAIIMEKYKANFLNGQVWSDWKRTGYPGIVSAVLLEIPRRFMYPDDELNANDNFPGTRGIWARNENDPAGF